MMNRPWKFLAAAALGMICLPSTAAEAAFSLAGSVNVTSDNTNGVVNFNPSNTTFTLPNGSNMMDLIVAYQSVDYGSHSTPNNNVNLLAQIKITITNPSGKGGGITVGNMTSGMFDANNVSLSDSLTAPAVTSFQVDNTTFTYLGFRDSSGSVGSFLGINSDSTTMTAVFSFVTAPAAAVPEPSSALLVALGLAGAGTLGARARRRRRGRPD